MNTEDTCRLAAELSEEFGATVVPVAARAAASLEADGLLERAVLWRALHAILCDIAAGRLDPRAPIAIH